MIFPFAPILIVDVLGSILMILFSIGCLYSVRQLRSRDPENVIWIYLLWLCIGLTAFSISRSAGHILKQLLYLTGHSALWEPLRPISGAINTFMFILVGSVTLFFERIWIIYRQISRDKQSLQKSHEELLFLNQNLEEMVTERTSALMGSEVKYRRIFESSQDMILVSDTHGTIQEVNPAGYRTFGYDSSNHTLKNRPIQKLFQRKKDWQDINAKLKTDGFVTSAEIDLTHFDGRSIRCLISASSHMAAADQTSAIYYLIKDIEKQQRLREQMAQTEKLASIGELSAGIAHEINNPLGVILGYTQFMLRNEKQSSERKDDLEVIEKQVRHCKSIVENLLDFARHSPPEKEDIHIHDILDDVLAFVKHHTELETITLDAVYDCAIPNFLLDEKKIRQVLINLIMNAMYSIDQKGTISIVTRYDKDRHHALVDVTDTGYGIEKKNIGRIFDPFFTTKPTGEGTGLGLSVSYAIIKNHGGEISVRSKPGKGTTFTIDLPIVQKQLENGK